MKTIRLLLEHLKQGPVTVRLPEHVPTGPGYRGLVTLQPERCVGCGICAYVCSPGAIEIRDHQSSYDWIYDPAKCTFCSRCMLDCPMQALAMTAAAPRPYTRPGELYTIFTLLYPHCRKCGRPAPPASEPLLDRVFGAPRQAIKKWSELCLDCRREARAAEIVETWNTAPVHTESEPLP